MNMIRKISAALAGVFFGLQALAQRPTSVPTDNEPLRVFESVESVIFYIGLPVLIIIFYVIWKKRQWREEAERKQGQEGQDSRQADDVSAPGEKAARQKPGDEARESEI